MHCPGCRASNHARRRYCGKCGCNFAPACQGCGFADIEVNMTGGYDPNSTSPDSRLIQAQSRVYQRAQIQPILWPRSGGSWPGYVFTNPPLKLPAGHFGLGHGARAHAPDEYYLIESSDPKLYGYDVAVRSFVDYLYELA